jgi:catechol 2,3-dioxygenase-like lactoylglutathione lyase family enzyme
MLTSLDHLALEVKYLDRTREFYEGRLGVTPASEGEATVAYEAGETTLALRRPSSVPRGGLHVHYAFATPAAEYDSWRSRLAPLDPSEHRFGSYRSLYVDDPDDHCVEIGGVGGEGSGLTGIFEVVLEVADLDAAVETYAALGFEVVDRGDDRRRVRLRGPVDLELWEPQLGLADARGGVHVDLGFGTDDPHGAADAIASRTDRRERVGGGVRVRDADCHYLTFRRE